jgi:hypothetical protein
MVHFARYDKHIPIHDAQRQSWQQRTNVVCSDTLKKSKVLQDKHHNAMLPPNALYTKTPYQIIECAFALILKSTELRGDSQRSQLLIVISQLPIRNWQFPPPRIFHKLQCPLKDKLPLLAFVLTDRYVGELRPAMSAVWSMPYF